MRGIAFVLLLALPIGLLSTATGSPQHPPRNWPSCKGHGNESPPR